jgi:hypothetical protein
MSVAVLLLILYALKACTVKTFTFPLNEIAVARGCCFMFLGQRLRIGFISFLFLFYWLWWYFVFLFVYLVIGLNISWCWVLGMLLER